MCVLGTLANIATFDGVASYSSFTRNAAVIIITASVTEIHKKDRRTQQRQREVINQIKSDK